MQCKARRCHESPSRQLKNEGEKKFPRSARTDRRFAPLFTAFGSGRTTPNSSRRRWTWRQPGVTLHAPSLVTFRRVSSHSLMMVFAQNSSISHRVVHLAITLSQPPSFHQAAAAAHSITMASLVTPFSRLYACAIT